MDDNDHIYSATVPLDTWVHLAFVKSGSEITFYVDGTAYGSLVDHGKNINDSDGDLRIGKEGSTYEERLGEMFFLGKIDDLMFCVRALTADQIISAAGGEEFIDYLTIVPETTPTIAPGSMASPIPTPLLARSIADIVATWHGKEADGVYQRFNEDGSCQVAFTLENLETPPNVECSFHFEETQLAITETQNNGLPPRSSTTGIDEVQLLADDSLEFIRIQDSCGPRARSTAQEHERIR